MSRTWGSLPRGGRRTVAQNTACCTGFSWSAWPVTAVSLGADSREHGAERSHRDRSRASLLDVGGRGGKGRPPQLALPRTWKLRGKRREGTRGTEQENDSSGEGERGNHATSSEEAQKFRTCSMGTMALDSAMLSKTAFVITVRLVLVNTSASGAGAPGDIEGASACSPGSTQPSDGDNAVSTSPVHLLSVTSCKTHDRILFVAAHDRHGTHFLGVHRDCWPQPYFDLSRNDYFPKSQEGGASLLGLRRLRQTFCSGFSWTCPRRARGISQDVLCHMSLSLAILRLLRSSVFFGLGLDGTPSGNIGIGVIRVRRPHGHALPEARKRPW